MISFGQPVPDSSSEKIIQLPSLKTKGTLSVEEAISRRRSVRSYRDRFLSLYDLSQLLWAAQGITSKEGFRTVPSAGALYPIEIYVVISKLENLGAGIYKYNPHKNLLLLKTRGEFKNQLTRAALEQESVMDAAVNLVICGDFKRTTVKYRDRGIRYVWMEAGHVAQNVYLQCESLGLGTVCIGAFYDDQVQKIIFASETPLYIMPIGKK